MSSNYGRNNLIMTFVCSACGARLDLRYGDTEEVKGEDSRSSRDPTGAACRYVGNIHIDPCRKCIEAKTKPAEKLAEAIKQLTAL